LRNPGHGAAKERHAGETVGQERNSLPQQRPDGFGIEAVTRRNPDLRVEAVAAQDAEALPDPCALRFRGHAGKLRGAVQIDQAAPPAHAQMAVAVQANLRSGSLESPHALPERRVGWRNLELRIAIVGNHGQNRLQVEICDQCLPLRPAFGPNRGAKIVDAQQVLRGF